jgi:hypothetical protein
MYLCHPKVTDQTLRYNVFILISILQLILNGPAVQADQTANAAVLRQSKDSGNDPTMYLCYH